MSMTEQMQFQRLPAEAQRAALWRLALSGLDCEQIAARTGWSAEQIRGVVAPSAAAPLVYSSARRRWRAAGEGRQAGPG
jgi:hypothetical protein